jgi:hypothetical protein
MKQRPALAIVDKSIPHTDEDDEGAVLIASSQEGIQ